jgi:hypothetical protein
MCAQEDIKNMKIKQIRLLLEERISDIHGNVLEVLKDLTSTDDPIVILFTAAIISSSYINSTKRKKVIDALIHVSEVYNQFNCCEINIGG